MSPNENNLLIDHLDQALEGQQLNAIQELILNNEEVAKEWEVLQFTATNIYDAGLYEQVRLVRDQYTSARSGSSQQGDSRGIVRTMTQKIMRVAAVLVFVTFSAVIYKYISVDDSSVYNKYYSPYELNTSRTSSDVDVLDNAYRNKNWTDVITIVNGIRDKTSKHFFLAGVAYLELKQYEGAIKSFQSVINKNKDSGDDYFSDEAQYYLAMSYLANNDAQQAMPILEKIKKDKNHLYSQVVSKMGIDFTILQLKEGK